MFNDKIISAIQVGLASPETIRSWSHGEVLRPETINYRSQKPEMQGLYCEKIFGPSKDYECHCGKYKKIRYAGVVCEKCGVEVTSKEVRRERMGHIELASPCTHIWYLKGIPSRIGLILDVSPKHLEEVVYFAAHICLDPGYSKLLEVREFVDEKNGREVFIPVLKEILDNEEWGLKGKEDSYDGQRAVEFISRLENRNEVFDYETVQKFVSKFNNCVFSEGAEAIKKLLHAIDLNKEADAIKERLKETSASNRNKLTKRLEVIKDFIDSQNKPEWMVLDVIPVIPPDLRPMLQLDGGRFATSDLNDLYRRVISRNNRLKKLIDIKSPYVILMNEKRMLQEAVDALIDNGRRNKPVQGAGGRPLKSLSNTLKGKQGRFRQNLLGKRVDYSGRSVIAVGPYLKMYQCGLPREMAIQLLRPFIACELLKRGVATAHKQADRIIDRYEDVVFDIIEEIISKHPVLLNRAPTLHRLGIQAFQPILVDGRAIRLHPLVCTGFNADFDGDQMAVHVPLSKPAQEEALHLMLASNNILGPKDGKPIVTPSQDMVLGNYYLTLEDTAEEFMERSKALEAKGDIEEAERYAVYAGSEGKVFRNVDDVIKAYETKQINLHNRIAIIGSALKKSYFTEEMNNMYLITTVGKVIFNLIYPTDFPYLNQLKKKVSTKKNPDGSVKTSVSYAVDFTTEHLMESFVPRGTNIREVIKGNEIGKPFSKKHLGQIINEIFKRYGTTKTSAVLDKIKDQGFKFSTVAGITVSLADIKIVEGKEEMLAAGEAKLSQINSLYDDGLLTDEERHKQVCDNWNGVLDQIKNQLSSQLEADRKNNLFMMSDSGARGNISNFVQLSGMRGLMGNTSGGTIELPVKSCFREGMKVAEFFISTHGARKGGADTALKTADSGYLTRRLVDVSHDVIVREVDCHTDHGFVVSDIIDSSQNEVIVHLKDRLIGRYSLHDIVDPKTGEVIIEGNHLITEQIAGQIVKAGIEKVEIRSIFGCETKDGVCCHCYGTNLATGKEVQVGEAVGVMAAQSIGEPGTQLTMRTFHTGGVAGSDITQGLPRVQELFEARRPKGEALISEIPGTVKTVKEDGGRYIVVIENKNVVTLDESTGKNIPETKTYTTNYGARLRVKQGDTVKPGSKITEGAIWPMSLLECADTATVERYLLKEVQKVYSSQAISISDKHIEIIVSRMLSKALVVDGGDTELLAGTTIDVQKITEQNANVLLEGKRPAVFTPLIFGIRKIALETDSFLSAASFQETTRALTDAAIKGKTDSLHGLKENVITGKLIPAGRGCLTEDEEEAILDDFSVTRTMKKVKAQYVEAHDKVFQERDDELDN